MNRSPATLPWRQIRALQEEADALCVARAAVEAGVDEALMWELLEDAGELPSQQRRRPTRRPTSAQRGAA